MNQQENTLGSFLKERRARLDPAAFGLPLERRRTPGLRREEVAQRAHVSATWYTWLEQGRGGAPSADVLDRLARALTLSEEEREYLYLLAQDRLPKQPRPERTEVTPAMQRVLDALLETPAIIRTPEWTVLAWNRAASVVLGNYGEVPPGGRNALRILFRNGGHEHLPEWESVARLMVASVRRDIARAGMQEATRELIEELSRESADFRRIWAEQDVAGHADGRKRLIHPVVGPLELEFLTFAVESRTDLALVVFNPVGDADREKLHTLLAD